MNGFHVTIEQTHVGDYEAIDNNRFESVDTGVFTGHGIGDTPHEACQRLIDGNRKRGVTLVDYVDDFIKAREFSTNDAKLLYRTTLFILDLWRGHDTAEGRALVAAVQLSESFSEIDAKLKEVKA